MAYNREEEWWAWLLVVLSKDFLVKGTAPAQKKLICAEMKINTSADFELCLSTEEEEEDKDGEIRVLAISRMAL